jgi:hypothetical protein
MRRDKKFLKNIQASRDNLEDVVTNQRVLIATLKEQLQAKDKEIKLLKQLIDELGRATS